MSDWPVCFGCFSSSSLLFTPGGNRSVGALGKKEEVRSGPEGAAARTLVAPVPGEVLVSVPPRPLGSTPVVSPPQSRGCCLNTGCIFSSCACADRFEADALWLRARALCARRVSFQRIKKERDSDTQRHQRGTTEATRLKMFILSKT